MKQKGFHLEEIATVKLAATAFLDAAFLEQLRDALRPYQRVGVDDRQKTLTIALVVGGHGNRSPIKNGIIVKLVTGELLLSDVFSADRLWATKP